MRIAFILILNIALIFSSYSENIHFADQNSDASQAFSVIPPNYAGSQGTASFLGPLSNAQRTYQLLIRDSLLTDLVGKEITAISWRLLASASSNWPVSDVTFTNYDIYLSESVAPENRSLTFSQNVVGPQKRVRFGSLLVNAGTYPAGGSPTTFGPEITFDSAYIYNGGHLLIEIRHTGFTGTSSSVDAIGTAVSGYGFLFSACWTGNYSGTSGAQGNFAVVRLSSQDPTGIITHTEIANDYSLKQNYPNPFNPTTNINFILPEAGKVTLKVYDARGSEVKTLIDSKSYNPGESNITFDGTSFNSGVYFYTLFVNDKRIVTRKMVLVK